MKKKFIILTLISVFLLSGCNSKNNENSNSNVENSNSNIISNSNNNESNSNVVIDYDKEKVGTNKVTLYLFYLSTCPHCHEEMEWLDSIEGKYDYLEIVKYEVKENSDFYESVVEKMEINDYHVPLTIIANDFKIGYSELSNNSLISLIEKHSTYNNCDVVKTIKEGGNIEECMKK